MLVILSLTGFIYAITIGTIAFGFSKTPTTVDKKTNPVCNFSILIACRNEANNLPKLLKNLESIDYPKHKYEVIFIDDHSEDDTKKIIETHIAKPTSISVLDNQGVGKKSAITLAVKNAKFDWIVTTDADCIVPLTWLSSFNSFLQQYNYQYISAPVSLPKPKRFIEHFQNLEFLSLQGTTIGTFGLKKPIMSNAANSCFYKPLFLSVNGYTGNEDISSGDDVFLLEKIQMEHPDKVGYLKSDKAIVSTQYEKNWHQLTHQRIRWAAKATSYKNLFGIFVGCIVLLANLLTIASLFLGWQTTVTCILTKFTIDAMLLLKTSRFFKQRIDLIPLLASSIIYPYFSAYIFILSQIKGFVWKGRAYKK
ncbi:glycosyltransferase [Flavicella marina]|uniref:glycosyltransferase n=1 Tax=Flavicella marina TaxID=1475951 RepID=UPI0012647829|nr:glycosyltransferase [Flavicella marina]